MKALGFTASLLFLTFLAPAPARANWLTDSIHNAGGWLQDKGSGLIKDSQERMNGGLLGKVVGAVERVAGEAVKAVGKALDWLSGVRDEGGAKAGGRDWPEGRPGQGGPPDPAAPPKPQNGEGRPGEAPKTQRDIGGDGNGEARGTGGADGVGEADGQSEDEGRWEPGQGGSGVRETGSSRFGRKEMDFGATETAARGVSIPGFSAGTVCTGSACGKPAGGPALGEPSLGSLLTKADLPAGFGKGRGGRSASSRAPADHAVDVTKSYEPALKAQGAAPPPVAPPAEEKRSWFSGVADALKNAAASVGRGAAAAGKAVVEAAKTAVAVTLDTPAHLSNLVSQKVLDTVNPLRERLPEDSLPRKVLDRVRLEALKSDLGVQSLWAKAGSEKAKERLYHIYQDDLETQDWQLPADAKKADAIGAHIAADKDITKVSGDWKGTSEQQKKDALQKVAGYAADEYGMKPIQISYKAMPCEYDQRSGLTLCTNGYYQSDSNTLVINSDRMGDFDSVANTVVHETTHQYQHKLTTGFPKVMLPTLGENVNDQRALMKANELYYISSDSGGFENYRNQPMERQARAQGEDSVVSAEAAWMGAAAVGAQ